MVNINQGIAATLAAKDVLIATGMYKELPGVIVCGKYVMNTLGQVHIGDAKGPTLGLIEDLINPEKKKLAYASHAPYSLSIRGEETLIRSPLKNGSVLTRSLNCAVAGVVGELGRSTIINAPISVLVYELLRSQPKSDFSGLTRSNLAELVNEEEPLMALILCPKLSRAPSSPPQ